MLKLCGSQLRIQDFPLGVGAPSRLVGTDFRRGHFLVKMYAKMKELDPIGGGAPPLDPPMEATRLLVIPCY